MNLKKKCRSLIIALSIVINLQFVKADTVANYNNQTYIQSRKSSLGVVKHCDYLNVKTGPSTKYSVVTKVYTNDTVTILENNSHGCIKTN